MKIIYDGLNSENPRRKIIKFLDKNNNCYTIVSGENKVYINFPTSETNKEGFTRRFIGTKIITLLQFCNREFNIK